MHPMCIGVVAHHRSSWVATPVILVAVAARVAGWVAFQALDHFSGFAIRLSANFCSLRAKVVSTSSLEYALPATMCGKARKDIRMLG